MRHVLLGQTDLALGEELDEITEEVQAARDWTRLSEQVKRRFARHEVYEFQLSRADGALIFQSNNLQPRRFPVPAVPSSLKHLDFETVKLGTQNITLEGLGHLRLMSGLVPGPDGPVVVQAATSLASIDRELAEL